MAVPTIDGQLASFAENFATRVSLAPLDYGISVAQAASLTAKKDDYVAALDALEVAKQAGTRSKNLTELKSFAKADLLRVQRELYGIIQSSLSVTDAKKIELGIVVKDKTPSPVEAPTTSPVVTVVSVTGYTVRYRIRGTTAQDSVARPIGAEGAVVLSFVGTTPPPLGDPMWKWEGQVTRSQFEVQYPSTVEPGTPVWVVAVWYTEKGETSPACVPLSTFLQIGQPAAA